jgi:tetratricopeptide (TPR) repeat protein
VLRLDPMSFLALVDAGDALLNLRQPEAALALGERAAALRPESPDGHDLVACCSWALGRRAEAVAAFERAAARDRLVAPGAWARIGRVELEAGNVAEAVRWLRRATDAFPGLALAHRDLGAAYAAGGDVDAAVRSWIAAARLGDPGARRALAERGVAW